MPHDILCCIILLFVMFAKDFLAARMLDSPDQSIPTQWQCTVSVVVVALVTQREVFDGSKYQNVLRCVKEVNVISYS